MILSRSIQVPRKGSIPGFLNLLDVSLKAAKTGDQHADQSQIKKSEKTKVEILGSIEGIVSAGIFQAM